MNTSKIKLSLLIFDFEVYPRHKISEYQVNELYQAIEAGKNLDPIIWDHATKTIIDGFHRVKAYKKIYGLDYEIDGNVIECKDKAEMILRSIEYNNKHGLKLSAWDKARCIALARAHKIKEDVIRKALAIPEERYKTLKERTVVVKNKNGKILKRIQLKRGQEKIAKKQNGIYVTEEEAEAIEGGGTTGLKAEIRIQTLIKDIDLNNFEITKRNIEIIKELVNLLKEEIRRFENE